jgi:hypothetical protein
MRIRKSYFLKIGQPTKVDPLSLLDESLEIKYVDDVTLENEMGRRTE